MPGTIGSSDVATILGLSPWGNAWDVWSRVRGDVGYDHTNTPSQARGRMLETALLAQYALDTGLVVVPGPPIGAKPVAGPEPWMHDRPDAWAGAAGGPPDRVLEAKTSRFLDAEYGWGQEGTDEVPLHYLVQCAWHMACCGLERCDLVAFGTVRDDFRVYTVHRDPVLEKKVINKARAWYQRHILGDVQPPPDDTDACRRALAAAYRARGAKAERPVREADDQDHALVERLREVRAAEDHIASQRKTLEAQLMQRMGDAGELRALGGSRLVSWGDRKGRDSIDTKALRRDHPEIARKYTTTGAPSRAFKLES